MSLMHLAKTKILKRESICKILSFLCFSEIPIVTIFLFFWICNNNLHTLTVVLYKLSGDTIECVEAFIVGITKQKKNKTKKLEQKLEEKREFRGFEDSIIKA
jgi:uncharacterized membrane protein